jgi:hypothetical protein
MSEQRGVLRRPPAAVLNVGLVIAAAFAIAGCGGGSSASTTTQSTAAQTTATTQATTTSASTTSSSTTTASGGLTGKWSGQYSGAYSGTFTLNWTQAGSKLSGKINLSTAGTVDVNGTVDGDSIKFGTVGGTAITYKGTVSGTKMSGTYQTPNGGGPWSATETS